MVTVFIMKNTNSHGNRYRSINDRSSGIRHGTANSCGAYSIMSNNTSNGEGTGNGYGDENVYYGIDDKGIA